MDKTIIDFRERLMAVAGRTFNAEVLETENSEATNIYLPALNREVNVYQHSDSVPPLHVGDHVLVECIDSRYIITHRLRTQKHSPQHSFMLKNDGMLAIKTLDGIRVQTSSLSVEVSKDGRIVVNGEEIYPQTHKQGLRKKSQTETN